MNIALYAPLKPFGTGTPSGDSSTLAGMARVLREAGHTVEQVSWLRARHIFKDPRLLKTVPRERESALKRARAMSADIWLTFHSYWKAPDLLGPWCCKRLGIPYVMHKGMHAEKRRRGHETLPGYMVNKQALLVADMVFTDDRNDLPGLDFLPSNKIRFLTPGIRTEDFYPDPEAGRTLRSKYGVTTSRLIASAAMFRPGVKTESIRLLIGCLQGLKDRADFHLLIAGDGPTRQDMEKRARRLLPGQCTFIGTLGKDELRGLYSTADVFVFPGIGESLGMVYLEAMCCGTPVVACEERGPLQLIRQGEMGLLADANDEAALCEATAALLLDAPLCASMGRQARIHVLEHHDHTECFAPLERELRRIASAPCF